MSEVKIPEPVTVMVTVESGPMFWDVAEINEAGMYCDEDEFPELLFTEAQLKQYGDDRAREALEMAAKVCETQDEVGPSFPNWWECASGIHTLAKEIK